LLNIVTPGWKIGQFQPGVWNKLSRMSPLFTIVNDMLFLLPEGRPEVKPEHEVMKIRVKINDIELDLNDKGNKCYHLENECLINVEVQLENVYLDVFSFTYSFRELT
jgi:hypothetical protein